MNKTKTTKKLFACFICAILMFTACVSLLPVGVTYASSSSTVYTGLSFLQSYSFTATQVPSNAVISSVNVTGGTCVYRGSSGKSASSYLSVSWNGRVVSLSQVPDACDFKNVNIAIYYSTPSYTVTFDLNGGDWIGGGSTSQTVSAGNSATAPSVVRSGYLFNGWSGSYSNVTSNRTVTATWVKNTYTVTFDLAGGVRTSGGSTSQTITNGYDAVAPVCERVGYVFSGWSGSFTNVTSSRTITALWTVANYNVTFDPNGGQLVDGLLEQTIAYGTDATLPIVTKQNCKFLGWSGSYKSVTVNQTLTALWEELQHTVTFDLNGGTFQGGSLTCTIPQGQYATVSCGFTRDGYTFAGWLPSLDETIIDKATTFVAQWTANTVVPDPIISITVNLYVNGRKQSTDVLNANITADLDTYVLNSETLTSHMQNAFVTNLSSFDEMTVSYKANIDTITIVDNTCYCDYSVKVQSKTSNASTSINVYAKSPTVKVTFDLNGGKLQGGSNIVDVPKGTKPTVSCGLDREGYSLAGWSLTRDGAVITDFPTVTTDLTFFAVWKQVDTVAKTKEISITNNINEDVYIAEFVLTDGYYVFTYDLGNSFKPTIFNKSYYDSILISSTKNYMSNLFWMLNLSKDIEYDRLFDIENQISTIKANIDCEISGKDYGVLNRSYGFSSLTFKVTPDKIDDANIEFVFKTTNVANPDNPSISDKWKGIEKFEDILPWNWSGSVVRILVGSLFILGCIILLVVIIKIIRRI